MYTHPHFSYEPGPPPLPTDDDGWVHEWQPTPRAAAAAAAAATPSSPVPVEGSRRFMHIAERGQAVWLEELGFENDHK
jgi:hypothetical protein